MKIKAYQSKKEAKDQLIEIPFEQFVKTDDAENHMLNIYPELTFQKILGFGGALTDSAAACYAKMSDKTKRKFIELMFDKEKGLGYNFCRNHINSCDFSQDGYTYCEENDETLETFDIAHDKKEIIPLILDSKAASPDLLLFSSPWSPPAYMKDTNNMLFGGKLLKKYYDLWAQYFVRYIEEYKKCGIDIFGVTVQNESKAVQTWESCEYTSEEQLDFVIHHLRPALDEAGLQHIKIMIWDHNKERVYDWARDTVNTEGGNEAVWGIAFHWYSGKHFDGLKFAHHTAPDKMLISSEFCYGGTKSQWTDAEGYAYDMIGNFNSFTNASCDWNIILDENGGPYHARGGGCKAVVHYNSKKDSLEIKDHYYAVAHFSKFIERDALRLGTTTFADLISIAAFRNPDGKIIAVIANLDDRDHKTSLRMNEYVSKNILPAHSITTVVIE